jgi:hypothetical protein
MMLPLKGVGSPGKASTSSTPVLGVVLQNSCFLSRLWPSAVNESSDSCEARFAADQLREEELAQPACGTKNQN